MPAPSHTETHSTKKERLEGILKYQTLSRFQVLISKIVKKDFFKSSQTINIYIYTSACFVALPHLPVAGRLKSFKPISTKKVFIHTI